MLAAGFEVGVMVEVLASKSKGWGLRVDRLEGRFHETLLRPTRKATKIVMALVGLVVGPVAFLVEPAESLAEDLPPA